MTVRAANILHRMGIAPTPAAVRQAITDHVLFVGLNGPLGYGITCHNEMCRFAGLPVPEFPRETIFTRYTQLHRLATAFIESPVPTSMKPLRDFLAKNPPRK